MNLYYITLLGDDILNLIYSYIPPASLYLLTKSQYILHHEAIALIPSKHAYHNFIRDVIRNKRDYVFSQIVKEHLFIWNTWNLYRFQNSTYNNYAGYILQFCNRTQFS